MSVRRACVASALALGVAAGGLPAVAEAQGPGDGKRVLIYTGTTGYRHTDGINGGRPVVQGKLQELGYTVDWEDCSGRGTGANNCNNANKNPRIFTSENLARYDALVFLNMSWSWNTANPGPLLDLDAQKNALIGFVQNGGGIASIHNATDAGAGKSVWDWWDGSPNSVIGTTMPGHAATNANGNTATVQTADNNHLATRDLPDTWQIADEHYNYLTNVRGGHHVLATFDERTYNPGVNARGQDHPITYCKLYNGASVNDGTGTPKAYRDGRTWVTGMGHFGVRYTENGGDNNLVKMIVGGVRWVAGEGRKSDCSGTVWSSFSRQVLVSDALNPIGIDVAPDGKVYWSEIGSPIGVESQGYIKMHDPKGPANNKTTVGTILTRADHGLSEDGVLGMSLQPGFDLADASKRNVFVYYSPRNAAWPTAAPAAQVVGYNQVSRFTLNAEGTAVVDGSERVILRVPKVKIFGSPSGFPGGPTNNGPGHVGGAGLDFDSAGNLYLGVGDDVSPNAAGHNGYQPMDYRSAERWDARKTSANTADLRGKVIRITPKQGEIAADATPGVGATYEIPEGNLFPVGTANTRPEIYGMGFRQPFTLHTDPANPGLVGVGEYCNDASTDRADRGFAGVCEWNLVDKPGNFGWPFCAGNQSPENTATRWNYATATSTGEKYDCTLDQIPSDINYAPEGQAPNPATFQGRHLIPKPTPATIWKKYPTGTGTQSAADFGDLSTGGMQPIAGPIYRYDSANATAGAFPRYYDGAWLINNRGTADGFWKEVRLRQDDNKMLRMNDWLPYNAAGTDNASLNSLVIGTQFGSDGALYMSRYAVGCCRNNTATPTQIVKISFNVYDETTAPSAAVELDPATPGAGRAYPGPVKLKLSATDAASASDANPVSGIDYIEYRDAVNGVPGAWAKLTNTAGGNTFAGTAELTAEGNHVVEYRAVDKAGNAGETKTIAFSIIHPVEAGAGFEALVPTILGLTLSGNTTFGALTPGVAKDYLAETTAKATATTGDAALSVADYSTASPGHLVNGSAVLPRGLQVSAGGGAFAPVSGPANAVVLKTWTAPVTNGLVPVTVKQPVGVDDALRAGSYSKTLTFTLSTTTP